MLEKYYQNLWLLQNRLHHLKKKKLAQKEKKTQMSPELYAYILNTPNYILTCHPGGSSGTVLQWGRQTEAQHDRPGRMALPRLPARCRCCRVCHRAAAACGPGRCCSGPDRALPGSWAETGHRTCEKHCSLEKQTTCEQRVVKDN